MKERVNQTICITATFTAEPVEKSLAFWMRELDSESEIVFTLYNQIFQQLLDSTSLLSKNQNGVNVILVRFEDWQRFEDEVEVESASLSRADQKIERNVRDLILALKSAAERSSAPHLVTICPASPTALADADRAVFFQQMEELLASELEGVGGVYLVTTSKLATLYLVSEPYDPYGDELGHIPYTIPFFTALGTMLARVIYTIQREPSKVIVLDCDNTLWKGVCGEDGALGIEIDEPYRSLQEFMVAQHDAGMLLCLCSKNSAEDVEEVFERRPEMPLRRDHVVSQRINWKPKSENIKSLSEELQLALDSFIFIDDNPVECAEVQANYPEVLTLRLPKKPASIPRFLDHIWAFDHLKITEEDKKRTALYQQNIQRQCFSAESLNFETFLAGLGLEIKISEMAPSYLARVSQLTKRTNQFNFTANRRSEGEIQKLCQSGKSEIFVVEVSDRFGDYGLVGVIIFEGDSKAINVDTFLLSCRVLGRGVEHRMLATLGAIAADRGLDHIDINFIPTQKNQPALHFLDGVAAEFKQQPGDIFAENKKDGIVFRIPVDWATELTYGPHIMRDSDNQSAGLVSPSTPALPDKGNASETGVRSEVMYRIATKLYDAEQILKIIDSQECQRRPDLKEVFVAPRTPAEELLARIWTQALNLDRVGIYDNFFDLGGDSLTGAVCINKLQAELGVYIYIVALFEAPTIAELAEYLDKHYPAAMSRLRGDEPVDGRESSKEKAVLDRGDNVDASKVAQIRQLIKPLPSRNENDAASLVKNPPAIFVLSPPRSGSTLLRVMLDGHPRLFAPPELELLSFNTLRERKEALSGRDSLWLEGTIRALMEIKGCDAEEAIRMMEAYEEQQLTTQQFYRQLQQWHGERILVDKTPSYALDIEILKRAETDFENAYYVHLLRHPGAVVRSFGRVKLDQVFFRYQHSFSTYQLAELIWLISHQNILAFLKKVPAHRQYRVKFEDLVKRPKPVLEGICEFLGLEYHPDIVRPYKDKQKKMTDGIHSSSRMLGDVKFHEYRGIDATVAGRWREHGTDDFLGELTWQVAETLGYEQSSKLQSQFEDNGAKVFTPIQSVSRTKTNDTDQLLAKLDQLSDDEIDSLLRDRIAKKDLESISGSSKHEGKRSPEKKRALLAQLLQEEANEPEYLPLSFAQQRLWFFDQLEPGSTAYNSIPGAVRIRGSLNVEALEQSINEILRRHEGLRTTFKNVAGSPFQVIAPFKSFALAVVDLIEFPEDKREAKARRLITEDALCPFDLAEGPLFRATLIRLDKEDHVFLYTMHHIVSDGWSRRVLVQELSTLYQAFSAGQLSPLPELPIQYADFASWQQQWLHGEVLDSLLGYWKKQLADMPPMLDLPTDYPRPAVQTFHGARLYLPLPQSLSEELRELSRQEGVTLFMTLLAAFKTLLYRYTGQEDVVVGTPIAGRNRQEIEGLIGLFIETLVLRTDLSGVPSFRELLGRVREVVLGALAHQDLPFEKLVRELQPVRDLSRTPLFQVLFNMIDVGDYGLELLGLTVEPFSPSEPDSKFDLTLYVGEQNKEIKFKLVYNTDLFDAATMARMLDHLQNLLDSIVVNPDHLISNFTLLTEEERKQLSTRTNLIRPTNSFTEFKKEDIEQSISARFEQKVKQYPGYIAVKTKNHQWTYSELNRTANQIAQTILRQCGSGNARIGLLFEHDAPMIAGIIGTLKAGKSYVPLDPDYPVERLAYILKDCQATAILTNSRNFATAKTLIKGTTQLVNIDEIDAKLSADNPGLPISPEALAYILYTSGSAGQPKGVMQNHRNVLHFIRAYTNNLHINADDKSTLFSPYSHDAAILDIVGTLLNGATLHLWSVNEKGLIGLSEWLIKEKITIFHSNPALYENFVDGLNGENRFTCLRAIVLGGEAVFKNDVEQYKRHFPQDCMFVNLYGSTESTISLLHSIDTQTEFTKYAFPLGYPVEDTEVFLLNEAGEQEEVYGEIGIRSRYVAPGYWQKPEITEATFQPKPEGGIERIYRTGDVGRSLPDGSIEFVGRKDLQVKIRGFRIELGEIEAVLGQHPAVRESVAMVREAEPADASSARPRTDKRLVSYVVLNLGQALMTSELRGFLKGKLPEYMVPSVFVFLGAIPLTPDGKVDRRSLPAPEGARPELEGAFVAPRNPTEEVLASIWSDLLGVEPVGIHDNFFDLGGHPLVATRTLAQLCNTFKVEIPYEVLYEAPTVAGLATAILQDPDTRIKVGNRSQLLLHLTQLSDDEIKNILDEKLRYLQKAGSNNQSFQA